jgi:hypothetical protein
MMISPRAKSPGGMPGWWPSAQLAADAGPQVDYVLHVQDRVLTPAQVTARIAAYRAAGTTFQDTVPGSR